MSLERIFKKISHRVGISIRPYKASTHPDIRLLKTLDHFKIDTVLDIGANVGQFAEMLIDEGFKGNIVSFEPISSCHTQLLKKASSYSQWRVFEKMAIGAEKGETEINISQNTVSSSLLDIKEDHIKGEPSSKFVSKEKIKVDSLDNLKPTLNLDGKNYMIKIDVQGFEMEVLKGAEEVLKDTTLVSVELSLVPMYENGNILYKDIIEYFEKRNFYLYGFQTAFVNNQTGQVLQADGIFAKK